jgi:tetratricopeptide (TPR) repeat protein
MTKLDSGSSGARWSARGARALARVGMTLLLASQLATATPEKWAETLHAAMSAERAGRYAEAQKLAARALALAESAEAETERVEISSVVLAEVYSHDGQCAKAIPLYHRALAILGKRKDADRNRVAEIDRKLAACYGATEDHAAEIHLLEQALSLRRARYGAESYRTIPELVALADAYRRQGSYPAAELLLKQAINLWPKQPHPEMRQAIGMLRDLTGLYIAEKKFLPAHATLEQELTAEGKLYGFESPEAAATLGKLGEVYSALGHDDLAEACYKRAITVLEKHPSGGSGALHTALEDYAALLRRTGRRQEAAAMEGRASALERQGKSPTPAR